MKVRSSHQNYADLLQWLQENIGPLLHSQPIIFWHGQGWHMKRSSEIKKASWDVDINDEKKAVLFALRWA